MKKFFCFGLFLSFFFFVSFQPVHAIIFLPAVILIPIAKILAVVLGGFSLPSFGIGILWHKLFGKSLGRMLVIIILFLLIAGVILALFLHFQNPDRPLF